MSIYKTTRTKYSKTKQNHIIDFRLLHVHQHKIIQHTKLYKLKNCQFKSMKTSLAKNCLCKTDDIFPKL